MGDRFQNNRPINPANLSDNTSISMPAYPIAVNSPLIFVQRRLLENQFILAGSEEEQRDILEKLIRITPAKTMDGSYLASSAKSNKLLDKVEKHFEIFSTSITGELYRLDHRRAFADLILWEDPHTLAASFLRNPDSAPQGSLAFIPSCALCLGFLQLKGEAEQLIALETLKKHPGVMNGSLDGDTFVLNAATERVKKFAEENFPPGEYMKKASAIAYFQKNHEALKDLLLGKISHPDINIEDIYPHEIASAYKELTNEEQHLAVEHLTARMKLPKNHYYHSVGLGYIGKGLADNTKDETLRVKIVDQWDVKRFELKEVESTIAIHTKVYGDFSHHISAKEFTSYHSREAQEKVASQITGNGRSELIRDVIALCKTSEQRIDVIRLFGKKDLLNDFDSLLHAVGGDSAAQREILLHTAKVHSWLGEDLLQLASPELQLLAISKMDFKYVVPETLLKHAKSPKVVEEITRRHNEAKAAYEAQSQHNTIRQNTSPLQPAPVQQMAPIASPVRTEQRSQLTRQELFASIDLNGNSFLDERELNKAVANHILTGRLAAEVAAIRKHYMELQKLSNDEFFTENDGVTLKDLNKLTLPAHSEQYAQFKSDIDVFARKITDKPTTLFGDYNRPSIEAFRQNGLGDCYLLAAAGSLAELRPEALTKMFRGNRDGAYVVNFPGGFGGEFTVQKPHDGEIASYVEVNKNYGLWPQVLEKAAGMFRSSYWWGEEAHAAVDHGSYPVYSIELLTGNKADELSTHFSSIEEIKRRLSATVLNKRIAVLSTSPDYSSRLKSTGLSDRHAYSVTNYDPKTGLFTVIDPNKTMNLTKNSGDGKLYLTTEQIKYYFSTVSAETDKSLWWGRVTI